MFGNIINVFTVGKFNVALLNKHTTYFKNNYSFMLHGWSITPTSVGKVHFLHELVQIYLFFIIIIIATTHIKATTNIKATRELLNTHTKIISTDFEKPWRMKLQEWRVLMLLSGISWHYEYHFPYKQKKGCFDMIAKLFWELGQSCRGCCDLICYLDE